MLASTARGNKPRSYAILSSGSPVQKEQLTVDLALLGSTIYGIITQFRQLVVKVIGRWCYQRTDRFRFRQQVFVFRTMALRQTVVSLKALHDLCAFSSVKQVFRDRLTLWSSTTDIYR